MTFIATWKANWRRARPAQWRLAGWINLAVGVMGLLFWAVTASSGHHVWWMPLVQATGPVINFTVGGFCLGKGY
jgi:hypothetical protein